MAIVALLRLYSEEPHEDRQARRMSEAPRFRAGGAKATLVAAPENSLPQ